MPPDTARPSDRASVSSILNPPARTMIVSSRLLNTAESPVIGPKGPGVEASTSNETCGDANCSAGVVGAVGGVLAGGAVGGLVEGGGATVVGASLVTGGLSMIM